jgi:hypothetical protein
MLKCVKKKPGVSTYSKVASIIYVMLSKGPDARESSARQTPRMRWKGGWMRFCIGKGLILPRSY